MDLRPAERNLNVSVRTNNSTHLTSKQRLKLDTIGKVASFLSEMFNC